MVNAMRSQPARQALPGLTAVHVSEKREATRGCIPVPTRLQQHTAYFAVLLDHTPEIVLIARIVIRTSSMKTVSPSPNALALSSSSVLSARTVHN